MSESDKINRAIAELRGTIINIDGEVVRRWPGTPAQVWPDYLEWQHAGKLLEEMEAADVWVEALTLLDGTRTWVVGWYKPLYTTVRRLELPDAIRRAWLSWEEQ